MKPRQLLLSLLALFVSITANAYDAYIGGFYFNFYGDVARVTYCDNNYNSYSGVVNIPVSIGLPDGSKFSVTGIGDYSGKDYYNFC